MKTMMLYSAAAMAALVSAGTAVAACPEDIDKLRTDLRGNKSFQDRYTAGGIDRGVYLQLFDAARVFQANGMEQKCQQVLAGIRELSQQADRPRTAVPRDGTPRAGDTPLRRDPSSVDQNRKQMLQAAKSLSEVSISADNLVGMDVRNTNDVDLGEVEDILMQGDKIKSIVVGRGDFLGMGGSYYEIAPDKVKVAMVDTAGTRGPEDRVIVIEMSEQQIESMPKLTKEDGRWLGAADDNRARPPSTAPAAPPSNMNKKN